MTDINELKARVYDLIRESEEHQLRFKAIQQEISRLARQIEEAEKADDKV